MEIAGKQHTLLAARQFVTEIIPPRVKARPKNCDDAGLETINENAKSASGGYTFRKIDSNKIEYCLGSYCEEGLYSVLFGPHQTPVIYSDARRLMVDGNGVLMIDADTFKGVCTNQKENSASEYDIIYEQCSERKLALEFIGHMRWDNVGRGSDSSRYAKLFYASYVVSAHVLALWLTPFHRYIYVSIS